MTTPIPGLQPRCFALVPAAGIGARSGADRPKQYVPIAGRAMITHTLAALSRVAKLAATLVVLSPQDALFENAVPEYRGARSWIARCGGDTRAVSVANGLLELQAHGAQPHDWVLVHDAARCLVQPRWIEKLIATCWDDAVGGLLALPIADTLKQASHGRATGTVERGGKWAAQTPQMFRLGMLQHALLEAGDAVTDEAGAIEAQGHQPLLVEAALENFKVTWPADFALAERLLRSRT
jgi:2-C-methyl-D-erythritol 4-phosphate cytidylyltransferase